MPGEVMLNSDTMQTANHRQHVESTGLRRLSSLSDIAPCQLQTNLLAKSLATRIKAQTRNLTHLHTGGNFLHLACINKEQNEYLSLRGVGGRLDSRSRTDRLKDRFARQREWELLTHPDMYDNITLPDMEYGSIRSNSVASKTSAKSLPVGCVTFGESNDHIGVVKRGGIFKTIHMYAPSRYQHKVSESPFKKPLVEYESVAIPQSGCISTHESKVRRKKGLKVTFTNPSCSEGGSCDTDRRGDDANKQKSKSTINKLYFKSTQDRIPSMGLSWDISPNSTVKSAPTLTGQVSRDLHPVTSGLNKAGTSEAKTKWRVSSSKYYNRPFAPLVRYKCIRN